MSSKDLEKENLCQETDFLSYLQELKCVLSKYTVIITVSGSGVGECFYSECIDAMLNLGLKINMSLYDGNPYVAIIDRGKVLTEATLEDKRLPLIVDGNILKHKFIIYSGGYACAHSIGCNAFVIIDGADYLKSSWGYNFLVFDVYKDTVVDVCSFNISQNGKCSRPFNEILYALEMYKQKHDGVNVCMLSLPLKPFENNATLWEKFILENNFLISNISDNKKMMDNIWNKKDIYQFCNEYENFDVFYESFRVPQSVIGLCGNRKYLDYESHSINIRNGIRVTVNQPNHPKRAIFIVGNCRLFGYGVIDKNTVPSLLQDKLNEEVFTKGFAVFNYAYIGADTYVDLLQILNSLPVKKGDIIFFQDRERCSPWNIPYCDLTLKSVRPHKYGEIFIDIHTGKNGNRLIADGMFEFLVNNEFFENDKADGDRDLIQIYKDKLCDLYKKEIMPKVGAVVMNCNPFTYGHRFLVERALEMVDYLVVFVVEEDKSVFSFDERMRLVKENLSDLKRCFIIPSGQFIISSRTFKEYFNKESMQDYKIDASLDVEIFCRDIAPCMNITVRFAGEEPSDNITRQYNENMARILPQYNIKFIEIPRKKYKGRHISASDVRSMMKEKQIDELSKLVPPPTLELIKKYIS